MADAAPAPEAQQPASSSSSSSAFPPRLRKSMSKAADTLRNFFNKLGKKREAKIREELARKLHENAGNMFRQGWFKVEAVAVIPNSLNCDVPFISGDVGSQILRTVTDPATVSNASAGAPAGAAATAGDATAATDAAAEPAAGGSRTVHFLPMEFGLFDGDFPEFLRVKLYDKDVLPNMLEKFVQKTEKEKADFEEVDEKFEVTELPAQDQVTSGMQITKEYDFQQGGKLTLTMTYTLEKPKCENTIVTSNFKKYLEAAISDEAAAKEAFKRDYPEAQQCRYLFVPGLFTEFYPGYYSKNLECMSSLGLDAKESKIKTTVGVEKNAEDLKAEILEMAKETPDKKIVLVGHSKGGVDIIHALMKYPELKQHVFGFIAMQAPYGGSYMIEWVVKHADKAASEVVTKLWGGEAKAYKDLAYSARQELNSVEVFDGKEVPTVCLASYADFRFKDISSLSDVGGVVSMKFAADIIERMCGAGSDGLVAQMDARVPGADCILVPNVFHSEPAMQFPGTKNPCGPLTQALLCCLFDKVRREKGSSAPAVGAAPAPSSDANAATAATEQTGAAAASATADSNTAGNTAQAAGAGEGESAATADAPPSAE